MELLPLSSYVYDWHRLLWTDMAVFILTSVAG